MITGYNTEIPFGGVIYHVQTEDMGHEQKKMITHVFQGGAILMSKKTSYEHLVAEKYDEERVKSLMNDQHKTILKIIKSGKLETLRQKLEKMESLEKEHHIETRMADELMDKDVVQAEIEKSVEAIEHEIDVSLNDIIQRYLQQKPKEKKLKIDVVAGTEIVSGQPAVIKIYTRDATTNEPLEGSRVIIKIIGMTFRPAVYTGRTDKNGVYTLNIIIPEFNVGQAAILIQASSEYGSDELKLRVSRRV
ncbi:MAG: hypothetical protein JXQ27_12210 [Acidobacteria bacterium]|nr:hypothetical protein [Acidobacteriota bacterium]